MRISDWSSDVWSSDLIVDDELKPEPVRDVEAYRSVDQRIGTHLVDRRILDRLDQAEFRLVAPEQLDIEVDVAKRRADIGLDPPSGQDDRACRLRYRLPGETLLIVTVGIEELSAEARSAARRGGQDCASKRNSRWTTYLEKKKKK